MRASHHSKSETSQPNGLSHWSSPEDFFATILKHHEKTAQSSPILGPNQEVVLTTFCNVLRTILPDAAENVIHEQAAQLLSIRMTHRVSTDDLVDALLEGNSVAQIAHFSKLVDELSDRPEGEVETHSLDTPTASHYEFQVATNGRASKYSEWYDRLDTSLQRSVRGKLLRTTDESVQRLKPIVDQSNLFEIRIHAGPGLRIYVGCIDSQYIILRGGKKDDQLIDILRAAKMLKELQTENSTYTLESLSVV